LLRWRGPADSDLLALTRREAHEHPDTRHRDREEDPAIGCRLFLLLSFRLSGKRLFGQFTTFDVVMLLVISSVLQNAAIGDDSSLSGGLLGVFVVMLLNWRVAWLTDRHKRLQLLVENVPPVLVRHRGVLPANLDREHLKMAERRAALRNEGVASVNEVRWALLEKDVSVVHRGAQPA
jgi:uncharacterized membrane protein YcaP (DUF421 family)